MHSSPTPIMNHSYAARRENRRGQSSAPPADFHLGEPPCSWLRTGSMPRSSGNSPDRTCERGFPAGHHGAIGPGRRNPGVPSNRCRRGRRTNRLHLPPHVGRTAFRHTLPLRRAVPWSHAAFGKPGFLIL